jgi:hypothetical protein
LYGGKSILTTFKNGLNNNQEISYMADIGGIALGQQDFWGIWHHVDGGLVSIPSFCVQMLREGGKEWNVPLKTITFQLVSSLAHI